MYHISKDKRSIQSAELIFKGLLKCLEKKSVEFITITDLQKTSHVARSTFYRSFDNLSDVLFWKCDSCFSEVLGGYDPQGFKNELELVRDYFTYWFTHSEILELLIKINRQDIIYSCHMKNAELLQQQFGKIPGVDSNYFMAIRTGFTISVLTAWLKGGRKENPDEVVKILREQLFLLAKEAKA